MLIPLRSPKSTRAFCTHCRRVTEADTKGDVRGQLGWSTATPGASSHLLCRETKDREGPHKGIVCPHPCGGRERPELTVQTLSLQRGTPCRGRSLSIRTEPWRALGILSHRAGRVHLCLLFLGHQPQILHFSHRCSLRQ